MFLGHSPSDCLSAAPQRKQAAEILAKLSKPQQAEAKSKPKKSTETEKKAAGRPKGARNWTDTELFGKRIILSNQIAI